MIRIWNPESGNQTLELRGHRGTVKRVAWTSDPRRLLAGGDDGLLHVWNLDTGVEIYVLAGHTGWIESVAAGPDALAVTAGGDRTLRKWDTRAGKLLATHRVQVPDFSALALSPSGKIAATAASDGTLSTWELDTGLRLQHRLVKSTALDLAFSPDGLRLASAQRGEQVCVWDAATLNLLRRLGP